jgi:hypothetical protein
MHLRVPVQGFRGALPAQRSGPAEDSIPATFLNIGAQTNTVIVSWFADPQSGLVLQQSSDLGTWTDTTNAVNIVNGTNQVLITPPTGAVFYRLGPP